jgi:hypothetical protein
MAVAVVAEIITQDTTVVSVVVEMAVFPELPVQMDLAAAAAVDEHQMVGPDLMEVPV